MDQGKATIVPSSTRAAAALALLLLSCGSRPGSTYSTLETMLKEDAAYSERLLNAEADSPDANLKEFDDFCDRSVELRTERLIKIQASLTDSQADLKKNIVDHFNAENSLVRAKRRFYDAYFELKSLRARYSDIAQKADAASALGDRYKVSDDDVAKVNLDTPAKDWAELKKRAETAMHYMKQSIDYRIESKQLVSSVNAAVATVLAAGKSYTESVERALETEKRLAADTAKLGLSIGTPINTSIKDVYSRSSATLKDVQSLMLK